ncbi:transposase [Streptomyces sp. NPDC088354]|uniref:transposase n=1 Tax=Streptomyces sp. NPDC088354 TaxID=3365856 RepID=UPI0038214C28
MCAAGAAVRAQQGARLRRGRAPCMRRLSSPPCRSPCRPDAGSCQDESEQAVRLPWARAAARTFGRGAAGTSAPWNRGQRPNPHPEAVVPLQQHRRLGLRRRPRRRSTGRRTSWTAVLDAVGLGPANDATAVTAVQLRDVVTRLRQPGRWKPGDPDMLIVVDSGHDVTHLAHVLSDLPVELVGRLRSDRVMLRDAGPRRSGPRGGQPAPRTRWCPHLRQAETWHTRDQPTDTVSTRLWHRRNSDPGSDAPPPAGPRPCPDHCGELPLIHGTLIRVKVGDDTGDRLGSRASTSP